MTQQKHLKARIRARMAKTGERYVTARRHLLGDQADGPAGDHGYQLRGGVHPETATIANTLANLGVTGTHNGQPLSEAMVLGVGGGLGAGYILWEFKAHHARVLVLGFRNQWQYPERWTAKVLDRLGIEAELYHTGGARAASERLDRVLDRGRPAIAWVDQQLLGYWHLPEFLRGYAGYPIVVHGRDGERVRVDDRNLAPLTISRAALDAARARIGSYQHRLVVIEPGTVAADRLRAAVTAGVADCAEHLSQSSASFSLPAWRKWARMMTDTRNAKAWPRVFADPRGLVGALVSMYERIEPVGTGGGNLRGMYADFLDEAAALLDRPELEEVAARFREIATAWHGLAEAALPLTEPALVELRELLAAIHSSVVADGDGGAESAAEAAGRAWELRTRYRSDTPLDAAATQELFATLGVAIDAIYEAEVAAVERLTTVVAKL
jgi:hypothetical protein